MNDAINFTQQQVDQLTQLINDASLEGQGAGKEQFCQIWPQVQSGLSALQGLLAVVPGVNVFAGPAIGIVLAAGSAASNAVCPKP
jgi:hypothetical protein